MNEEKNFDIEDKSQWIDGVWKIEPDHLSWVDPDTGYDCLIHRSGMTGALCGYVGIKKSHPDFGKGSDNVGVDVHGGLTYSAECDGPIWHESDDKEPVWWLGFDCAHFFDLSPKVETVLMQIREKRNAQPNLEKMYAAVDKINSFKERVGTDRLTDNELNSIKIFNSMTKIIQQILPVAPLQKPFEGQYRDIDYVKKEVESLAQQLKGRS
jgi:hypothetical protein